MASRPSPSGSPLVRAPSRYVEHAPSPALRPYVACFWTREASSGSSPVANPGIHRILPDGCIDVVVGYTGDRGAPESIMVVGTMTRALVLDAQSAVPHFVGVRFRPGCGRKLLGVPASEVTDVRVPVRDVWRGAADIDERLATDGGALARVARLEQLLVARLASPGADEPADDVGEAVRRIVAAGGSLGITRLAPSLGISRQHLARRFAEHVGVSPKVFARIVRLNRAVERARATARDAVDWTRLAFDTGYYDQPHLVDEFREMTGVTPTVWLREQAG